MIIGLATLALAQAAPQNPFAELFPRICLDRSSRCRPRDPVAVPPCPNAASEDCDPWQRDWSTVRPRETDYFEIGVGDDGSRWSIQNQSIVRARGRADPEIWVNVDYDGEQAGRVRNAIFRVRIRCAARQMGTLGSTRYDETGSVIGEEIVQPRAIRYTSAAPGTISSIILRTACGG